MSFDLSLINAYLEKNYVPEKCQIFRSLKAKECICLDIEYNINTSTFQEEVFKLIDKNSYNDAEVYKRAFISKQTFSKIRKDSFYHPDKDTAIKICLGLKLSLNEAISLLEKAGYTLSFSIKRDLVFRYFLLNKEYDVLILNETLYKLDMPLLSV